MALTFDKLIALWTEPPPPGDAALAAFGKVYTDPVIINGAAMSLAALVERARATQAAFADLKGTLLSQLDTPAHTVVVFRMSGRHVGPLVTPLGVVAPTGKTAERQVIDVLAIEGGLISSVWMVSDELGALVQLGALKLA